MLLRRPNGESCLPTEEGLAIARQVGNKHHIAVTSLAAREWGIYMDQMAKPHERTRKAV